MIVYLLGAGLNFACAIWWGWHAWSWFVAGFCLALAFAEANR